MLPIVPVWSTPDGDSPIDENEFLRLLESTRGLQVHRAAVGEPCDACTLTLGAWHSEWPRMDDGWCAQQPMLAHVRAQGARVLLTGHWSDQLMFVTGYLSDLFVRLGWRQIAVHLTEYKAWFADADPAYFAERFRRELLFNLTPHALRSWFRRCSAA